MDQQQTINLIQDIEQIRIFGVKISLVTEPELHLFLSKIISQKSKGLILNVNVHALNLAYQLRWFRDFLNQADIVFCDGSGVMVGARILGYKIPQRITYADWMWHLVDFCVPLDYSFYFLGAKPGIANEAARQISSKNSEVRIVGVHHGYFNHDKNSRENQEIINEINDLNPNFLILGFGMPLQELWLSENWENLNVNIALSGGAVFDYISGNLRRPPKWLTEHGMEWLGRLLIEPKRLWKRYLLGNPIFLFRILKQRIEW